jgi:hypothetical protein
VRGPRAGALVIQNRRARCDCFALGRRPPMGAWSERSRAGEVGRDACRPVPFAAARLSAAPMRRRVLARPEGVPGRDTEVGVLGGMVGVFQGVRRDVGLQNVGHRIASRFEEQEDVFAIGDPGSTVNARACGAATARRTKVS